ncbi:type-2 ice-structuring protein-like [Epinephelus moara]|uniref:type-2 ice-structuring protein-like n=1 Tax=Epinephelus moara TaxID=300413 RepID=UPI00214E944D|nr:type-2 ice-structuring protein-like [Epinephelus moara]
MKMLTVSALLCALLVLTRATSPAEGENDTETEKPTESAPAPSEEGPGAEDLHVSTVPPTAVPTAIYDDFGFHHFGFSCPGGWTMFDAHCLLYVPENMTWADAEQNCQSGNGNFNAFGSLVSVFQEYYFDDIQEVMQKAGHKSGQVWVGGSKAPGDSSWSWSDHMSPNIFPNWCSGEPSKENCLKINFEENASGCLEGSPCDAELPSVCGIILM